jgi:hypothetical protein
MVGGHNVREKIGDDGPCVTDPLGKCSGGRWQQPHEPSNVTPETMARVWRKVLETQRIVDAPEKGFFGRQ